jgi:acyl dehydratase
VVPTWEATMTALVDLVPPESMPMLLHAGHDMRFHRPMVPGMTLVTVAEPYNIRPTRAGTWMTLRVASADDGGVLVLEQFATMFIRGFQSAESGGGDRPDHSFPQSARDHKVAEVTDHIDADQTFRYRDASGDDNRIHVDEDFARSVGLPGIIVHGLCTMAMCGAAVVRAVAGGDPTRLKRLAVRFSKQVLPDSDLVTTIYRAGEAENCAVYAFEAVSRLDRVIRDGRAEVAG